MKVLVALAVVLTVASALPHTQDWEEWKQKYNKQYSASEEGYRQRVWLSNLKFIEEFDSDKEGYSVAMNQFGDLGQCGSCWAFSATGSLEGQHFNATGKLVSLSEQNLVDCSMAEGNEGCNGGLPDNAFEYVIKNGGIDTESSYPYVARDEKCRFSTANVGSTCKSYVDIASKSESQLQVASATVGPISVGIDASELGFQFYRNGVYHSYFCSQTRLDHGVLVVGYGVYSDKDYWLVKNSWGTTWGMDGYIMMSRNRDNNCGIATEASYPVVTAN